MNYSFTIQIEEQAKKKQLDEIAKLLNYSPDAVIKRALEHFIQEHNSEREWFKNRGCLMEIDKAKGNLVSMQRAFKMLPKGYTHRR